MLRLPEELRSAFKDPLGPVYTDAEELLRDADSTAPSDAESRTPIVAVGDVVTYHLLEANRQPDVAVVDGLTERERIDEGTERALEAAGGRRISVANPAAELSEALLEAIGESIRSSRPTIVEVDGEEDLATLPALVAAPIGSSVVYGQPGEGMVHVPVTRESRAEAIDLLSRFEGDSERAIELLEGASASE